MKLTRDFYIVDGKTLAINLLGKVLCFKKGRFRIVETEGYLGAIDKASHAYNNKLTKRTEPLYLSGGHVYIYLIYGMYHMLNIDANVEGIPEAVLIRALEPLDYHKKISITNGPGKLCKALGIDMSYNKLDLVTSDELFIEDDGYKVLDMVITKRINIDYAESDKDLLLRFYINNNVHVSRK